MVKKGKIECGYEFAIDDEKLNDMRAVDALAEFEEAIEAGQDWEALRCASWLVKYLLGAQGRRELYKLLEDENGKVTTDAVTEALGQIFEALGDDAKNSEPSPAH